MVDVWLIPLQVEENGIAIVSKGKPLPVDPFPGRGMGESPFYEVISQKIFNLMKDGFPEDEKEKGK